MTADAMSTLRSFSRCFTERLGVLDENFLGRGRPLSQARLIFEVGPAGKSVSELRQKLRLDAGYLSRQLSTLREEGLLSVGPDPRDGRRRTATLTARGLEEWEALDHGSDDAAAKILDPLTERQRDELAAVLRRAEDLLQAAAVTFDEVTPTTEDARWATARYAEELAERFGGYDPGGAFMGEAAEVAQPADLASVFVLAYRGTEVIGCGGVQSLAEHVGEIKRMWVAPSMRGLGVGRRMLADLEERARALGHAAVRLDTNGALVEAIAMYESAGYHQIERYNDNPHARLWFEKAL